MKRILAVIVFFAAATSLALGQTADKQETTKGEKADVEQLLLQMERYGNEATVKKVVATLRQPNKTHCLPSESCFRQC
jgi:hypothetical protein